jgi:hypothetical protein
MVYNKKAQMKIQQMAFMIIAIFIFFVLVGLFFLQLQLRDLRGSASDLEKEQATSSIGVISSMSELACESGAQMCLDKDKLRVMQGIDYEGLWPVDSVGVYVVYPAFDEVVECPGIGCNYYDIFDSGTSEIEEYSGFVSICEKIKESGYVYDRCEIGKLVVGVKNGA